MVDIHIETKYDSKTQEIIDDIELEICCRKAYFFDSALLPNADIEKIKTDMECDTTLSLLQKQLADVIAMAIPKYICVAGTEEEKKILEDVVKQYKENKSI